MTTNAKKQIRVAVVSDIHLGHNRNPTSRIIENLNTCINNIKFLKTIDILFIAGDLFDKILPFPSNDARQADMWMMSLLSNCATLNVKLRVLEGTPSHDREQSARFLDNNEKLKNNNVKFADLKYVNDLEIEYMQDYDIHILYLPDEYGLNTQYAYSAAVLKLQELNIDKVDIAIMHGMFDYQLDASIPGPPRHNSTAWIEIVKSAIFIGHVHTFSTFNKIVAQGSFDRLAHAEEEPKGFVRAIIYENGEYTCEFIENKKALKFITLDITEPDLVDCITYIDGVVKELESFSYIRVRSSADHPIQANFNVIKNRHPFINWSIDTSDKKSTKISDVLAEKPPEYTPVKIDSLTIESIIKYRLEMKSINPEVITSAIAALNQIKANIK